MFILHRLDKDKNEKGFVQSIRNGAVHKNVNFEYLYLYISDTNFSKSLLSRYRIKADIFNDTDDKSLRKLQLDNGRLCYKLFKQTQFKRLELFVLIF